jgi:hypothetical protein
MGGQGNNRKYGRAAKPTNEEFLATREKFTNLMNQVEAKYSELNEGQQKIYAICKLILEQANIGSEGAYYAMNDFINKKAKEHFGIDSPNQAIAEYASAIPKRQESSTGPDIGLKSSGSRSEDKAQENQQGQQGADLLDGAGAPPPPPPPTKTSLMVSSTRSKKPSTLQSNTVRNNDRTHLIQQIKKRRRGLRDEEEGLDDKDPSKDSKEVQVQSLDNKENTINTQDKTLRSNPENGPQTSPLLSGGFPSSDMRSDLLAQIRSGTTLKNAQDRKLPDQPKKNTQGKGLTFNSNLLNIVASKQDEFSKKNKETGDEWEEKSELTKQKTPAEQPAPAANAAPTTSTTAQAASPVQEAQQDKAGQNVKGAKDTASNAAPTANSAATATSASAPETAAASSPAAAPAPTQTVASPAPETAAAPAQATSAPAPAAQPVADNASKNANSQPKTLEEMKNELEQLRGSVNAANVQLSSINNISKLNGNERETITILMRHFETIQKKAHYQNLVTLLESEHKNDLEKVKELYELVKDNQTKDEIMALSESATNEFLTHADEIKRNKETIEASAKEASAKSTAPAPADKAASQTAPASTKPAAPATNAAAKNPSMQNGDFIHKHLKENLFNVAHGEVTDVRGKIIEDLWHQRGTIDAIKQQLANESTASTLDPEQLAQLKTKLAKQEDMFYKTYDALFALESRAYESLANKDTNGISSPHLIKGETNKFEMRNITGQITASFQLDENGLFVGGKPTPTPGLGQPVNIVIPLKDKNGKELDGGKFYLRYDKDGNLTDFDTPGPMYVRVGNDKEGYKIKYVHPNDLSDPKKAKEYGDAPIFIERKRKPGVEGESFNLPVNFAQYSELYRNCQNYKGKPRVQNVAQENQQSQGFTAPQRRGQSQETMGSQRGDLPPQKMPNPAWQPGHAMSMPAPQASYGPVVMHPMQNVYQIHVASNGKNITINLTVNGQPQPPNPPIKLAADKMHYITYENGQIKVHDTYPDYVKQYLQPSQSMGQAHIQGQGYGAQQQPNMEQNKQPNQSQKWVAAKPSMTKRLVAEDKTKEPDQTQLHAAKNQDHTWVKSKISLKQHFEAAHIELKNKITAAEEKLKNNTEISNENRIESQKRLDMIKSEMQSIENTGNSFINNPNAVRFMNREDVKSTVKRSGGKAKSYTDISKDDNLAPKDPNEKQEYIVGVNGALTINNGVKALNDFAKEIERDYLKTEKSKDRTSNQTLVPESEKNTNNSQTVQSDTPKPEANVNHPEATQPVVDNREGLENLLSQKPHKPSKAPTKPPPLTPDEKNGIKDNLAKTDDILHKRIKNQVVDTAEPSSVNAPQPPINNVTKPTTRQRFAAVVKQAKKLTAALFAKKDRAPADSVEKPFEFEINKPNPTDIDKSRPTSENAIIDTLTAKYNKESPNSQMTKEDMQKMVDIKPAGDAYTVTIKDKDNKQVGASHYIINAEGVSGETIVKDIHAVRGTKGPAKDTTNKGATDPSFTQVIEGVTVKKISRVTAQAGTVANGKNVAATTKGGIF